MGWWFVDDVDDVDGVDGGALEARYLVLGHSARAMFAVNASSRVQVNMQVHKSLR